MSQDINPNLKILNERFDAYAGNWCVDPFIGRDGTISVWPTKDGFAHDLNGTPLPNSFWPLCRCMPALEEQPNGVVLVIHNAMSGDGQTPTEGATA